MRHWKLNESGHSKTGLLPTNVTLCYRASAATIVLVPLGCRSFYCSEVNFRQIQFSETELPVKTIRKAPIDLDLKPQKSTKRFEKALFRCFGGQEWRGQRLLWPLFGQFRMRGSRKLKGKEKEDRSGDLLLCGGEQPQKKPGL
jgi:hypothetical protein